MAIYPLSTQEPEPTVMARLIDIDKAIEEDPDLNWEKRILETTRSKEKESAARLGGIIQGTDIPQQLYDASIGIPYRDILDRMLPANEGYRTKPYKDSKDNWTAGIGATGTYEELKKLNNPKAIRERYNKDVIKHENRAKEALGSDTFDELHPLTRSFVVDSFFRGGLAGSPNTINLIKQGRLNKAGHEFLRGKGPFGYHKEYYSSWKQIPYWDGTYETDKDGDYIYKNGKKVKVMKQPGPGVAKRMKRFSDHLKALPTKVSLKEERRKQQAEHELGMKIYHEIKRGQNRDREQLIKENEGPGGRREQGLAGEGGSRYNKIEFKQGTTYYHYDVYIKIVHPNKKVEYKWHGDN